MQGFEVRIASLVPAISNLVFVHIHATNLSQSSVQPEDIHFQDAPQASNWLAVRLSPSMLRYALLKLAIIVMADFIA